MATSQQMARTIIVSALLVLVVLAAGARSLVGASGVGSADVSSASSADGSSSNAERAAALNALSTREVLDQVADARHSAVTVTVGGYTFTVDAFEWKVLKTGEYVPVLGADQDARLSECGHDTWPDSMGVFGGSMGGFCISSIDLADPESIAAARVLAKRLFTGAEFSDAEINALRLWTLAGYADQDSEAAAKYQAEFEAAIDALSPEEKENMFS